VNSISKENAEMIFSEYSQFVYKTALFLIKSKELADDITQETFIKVFNKYNTYNFKKPMKPWIYKITLNVTRNTLRKQKWLSFWSVLPDNSFVDLVENTVLKSEEERQLWREINLLSIKSKEIIVLHFYSGMTLKKISEILNIPEGTCKSRLSSGLSKLRERLPKTDFNYLKRGGEFYGSV